MYKNIKKLYNRKIDVKCLDIFKKFEYKFEKITLYGTMVSNFFTSTLLVFPQE